MILGDFAHNVRSALDHLVWQLVIRDGGKPGRHNGFPIYDTEAEYVASVVEKPLGPLAGINRASDEWAFIERQQPYHVTQGEPYLPILRYLSNHDKHRIVHPTLGVMGGFMEAGPAKVAANEAAGEVTRLTVAHARRIHDGAEVARAYITPRGPNPHVEVEGKMALQIAFGERLLKSEVLPPLHEYVAGLCATVAQGFQDG